MSYNYSKLLGRIRECGLTQRNLAETIHINPATLSAKLNGKNAFTTPEIVGICKTLNIQNDEIVAYFFAE